MNKKMKAILKGLEQEITTAAESGTYSEDQVKDLFARVIKVGKELGYDTKSYIEGYTDGYRDGRVAIGKDIKRLMSVKRDMEDFDDEV